jgi:hypothetical protein
MRQFVAANRETDSERFSFEGAIVTDKISVGDLFVGRHFMLINKIDCVGSKDVVLSATMCKASAFIAETVGPCRTILAFQESVDCFLFSKSVANVIYNWLKKFVGLQKNFLHVDWL